MSWSCTMCAAGADSSKFGDQAGIGYLVHQNDIGLKFPDD